MAQSTTYILAIDQGTTGTTVALVDHKGRVITKTNTEYRQIYPKPGWVEHKPDDIYKSVLTQIQACLKKSRIKASAIAGIGITNQRETVVVWDKKTGKPIHNAIVWQDRRTTDYCESLKAQGHEKQIQERTGLVIDPYFSASKINWILNNVSGAKDAAAAGKLLAGTIDTYLLWRMSAGQAHKTDVSNASRTQLLNIKTAQWDSDLLRIFAVDSSLLPEVCDSSGVFASTKGMKVLPDGIPISGIAGDQQAALFGQTCFEAGESKCTFGTGSFLLLNTGGNVVRSQAGLLSTIAWRLKGQTESVYALEGGAFICGAAVQFLRDQLGFIKSSSEIERLAKSVKSNEGVEFVPALTGLGAPHWNPSARGLITGLTRGSTRAHIARATLDAMALQNADILLAMQKDAPVKLKSVRVDGGASANDLLMQIQADYLGLEVVRPAIIETTVAGAAYLAGLGIGFWNDVSEIKKVWRINKRFQPKISDDLRATRFRSWKHAVSQANL